MHDYYSYDLINLKISLGKYFNPDRINILNLFNAEETHN